MSGIHGVSRAYRPRLIAVFAITSAVFLVELVIGFASGSLALLADAGHMFTDVAGIGLALIAMRLAGRPVTDARSFGLYRAEILAAVVNAVLLFGVALGVLFEAWRRLTDPPAVDSGLMVAAALVGLLANTISLLLLSKGRHESLNLRGAYLEVLGDLLGSIAVIVTAVILATTGFALADPIASALIGVMILPRTWHLLREAVDVLLEATPRHLDIKEVRQHIAEAPDVADVHDLHAWTITSGMPVISAHVVLQPGAEPRSVLEHLHRCLAQDFDIEHCTFQLETEDRRALEHIVHP